MEQSSGALPEVEMLEIPEIRTDPALHRSCWQGTRTCCETVAVGNDMAVQVKTEPCSPPHIPLLSPHTIPQPSPILTHKQGQGRVPYRVRLKPFAVTDSHSVDSCNSLSQQTGFEVVFKSEPLSEAEAEEESGPGVTREQPSSQFMAATPRNSTSAEAKPNICEGGLNPSSPLSCEKGWFDGEFVSKETSAQRICQNTVSMPGVTEERVLQNVCIKTEPADDTLCISMGLLASSNNSNTTSVHEKMITDGFGGQNGIEEKGKPFSSKETTRKGQNNSEKEAAVMKDSEGEKEQQLFSTQAVEKGHTVGKEEDTLVTPRSTQKKQPCRKLLQCPQCPSVFPCRSHLRRHALSHREDRPHTCPVCQAAFKLPCHLKQHALTHTGDRPFACQLCSATFTRSDHLKQHMMSHGGIRPYLCTVCNTAFTQAAHLRKHIMRHRDDRTVVCKVKACRAVFSSVLAFEEHRRQHEDDRRCKICQLVLSRADDLKKHMRIHTKDRPFACAVCPARFTQAGHLSTHERQHSGSRPFVCQYCPCAFRQTHHLRRHLQVHRAQGRFCCQACGATFHRGSSLTRHRQKCHPNPSTSVASS